MNPSLPRAWASASEDELKKVRGVCLDIDETLSTRGKLTSEAYEALWALNQSGFAVVPITGRPAGWCDQIARFWPVDAVVGENGAFTFFMQKGVRRRLDTPGTQLDAKVKLGKLAKKVLERFPQAKWASDQGYREFDLAIDVCEDVKPWPQPEVEELIALCVAEGAHVKLSSIHVNTWFGDYDKKKGFQNWLTHESPGFEKGLAPGEGEWLFIGDSPNDEPMFSSFQLSVGVANLHHYMDRLKNPPLWITEAESGAGFVEMARKLIASRGP